jgi:DNA-binding CsgD family transcriptional regulator
MLPPGPEIAMAYSYRAQLHMLCVESRQAVHWGHRALELAERLSLLEVEIHALNNVGAAALQRRKRQGWRYLERSLQLALASDMHDHAARAYANLAWQAVIDRDYARAGRYLDDGLGYAMHRDLDSWTFYMLGVRARRHLEQGRWQEAAADAGAVLEASRAALLRINPLLVLGLVRVRRGDPGGDELLGEARALAMPTGEVMRIGPLAAACAEAAWLKGLDDRCLEEARVGYALASRHRDPALIAQLGYWLWRAGGTPEASFRTATGTSFERQIRGDWQAAAEQWRQLGCPYEEALALAEGDSFSRLRSLAILDELGARPAAALVRRGLRADGVRQIPRGARPATKRNPAGLTARETEILRLLVDGLSNRRIAERLCISAKTVDHHVSAVLGKLGVQSREQAATRAIEGGLLP